jgi:hypothetical protein
MSLIKVWTEIGNDGKCYSLPAKIISKKGNGTYVIQYLSYTDRKTRDGKKIYMYEDETYEVTDNSITEYLETDSELDLGFEQISGDFEFVKYDSDSDDEDYVPSSEDSSSSSSEDDENSLISGDEEEDDDDVYDEEDDD